MGEQPKSFQLSPTPNPRHHSSVLLFGLCALFLLIVGGEIGFIFGTNNKSLTTPRLTTKNDLPMTSTPSATQQTNKLSYVTFPNNQLSYEIPNTFIVKSNNTNNERTYYTTKPDYDISIQTIENEPPSEPGCPNHPTIPPSVIGEFNCSPKPLASIDILEFPSNGATTAQQWSDRGNIGQYKSFDNIKGYCEDGYGATYSHKDLPTEIPPDLFDYGCDILWQNKIYTISVFDNTDNSDITKDEQNQLYNQMIQILESFKFIE